MAHFSTPFLWKFQMLFTWLKLKYVQTTMMMSKKTSSKILTTKKKKLQKVNFQTMTGILAKHRKTILTNKFHILTKLTRAFRNISERNLLLILSVFVGLGSGIAAVILEKLIEVFQHLFFGVFYFV